MTEEEADNTSASEEVKELKQKVASLKTEIKLLKDRQDRVSAQTNLLTTYSDGLFSAGKDTNTADLLDVKTIGNQHRNSLPSMIMVYCLKCVKFDRWSL